MNRLVLAILAVAGAAVALGCGVDARPAPTRGLSLHQARSALFLDRETVIDLRVSTDEPGEARDGGIVSTTFQLGDGWFMPQASGRWAVGGRSALSVYALHPEGLGLFVESRAPEVESIQVTVNGVDVGVLTSGDKWTGQGLELPEGLLRTGANEIAFAFAASRPAETPVSSDPATTVRSLFVGLQPTAANLHGLLPRIREVFPGATIEGQDILNLPGVVVVDVIRGIDEDGVGSDWAWEGVDGGLSVQFRRIGLVEAPESFMPDARLPAFSRDRGALTVARSGTLFVPVDTRQPAESVVVAASMPTRLRRSADVRVSIDTGDDRVELASETLDGWWGRSRFVRDLPVSHVGPGCVVVDMSIDPNGSPLGLEAIDLISAQLERDPLYVAPDERPDIVLIVLDAARSDHFGSYGYDRDTTPNIDRLAAESLVFENAFATASYTVASMPTMLTGLSFIDHGMFWRGQVLAEPITTLAESLQQAGYRTSCFSANPNNAVALGLGQGCDQFEEFWRHAAPPRSIDPYRVSNSVLRRLASRDEEDTGAPEFLLLHYVPPHEPYTPAAGFDIFGDDAYSGVYDGSRDTIVGIDARQLHPTQADINEIVSLYDGNLLTGDDAVSQVLEALQARGQWDNTVVMVVSDHGEGFGEHGRMSHNSTVYDEMIQVPFVLRLPGGAVPAGVDTEGLVSLEDVVPTLLAAAGVDATGVFSGVNLLGPGAVSRRRAVVARTSSNPPTLAYRTPEWKLIEGAGFSELYDLRADPDERENVFLDQIETALCLRSLLRLELTRPPMGAVPGDGVEVSGDDLDTLRSLGYVR